MSPHPRLYALLRHVSLLTAIACAGAFHADAQDAQPPAYLTVVTGEATLERAGESEPATANMPFVAGDRLRTGAGRVEIAFPDGTAIEVGENSEVEAISPTRVRLIAGTMDHIQRTVAPSRSASYLPQDLQTYGNTFDQYGSWQLRPAVRVRLVPAGRGRLASVFVRRVVADPFVRLDLGRRRGVGVADASLRSLGLRAQRVVLDPGPDLGRGVGLVVVCRRLRELVSARLEQPSRLRAVDWIAPRGGTTGRCRAGRSKRGGMAGTMPVTTAAALAARLPGASRSPATEPAVRHRTSDGRTQIASRLRVFRLRATSASAGQAGGPRSLA